MVGFVPMRNVRGKINVVSFEKVAYEKVKTGFTIFKRGDLLWAKITPCMQNGKSCLTDDMPSVIGFGSTEFHVVRKRAENIYMPFIWAVLSNDRFLKAAQSTFCGSAGQQRVPVSFINNFPAVLPEYNLQVKLSKDLEERLASRNDMYHQAEELLSAMDEFVLRKLQCQLPSPKARLSWAVSAIEFSEGSSLGSEYFHPERLAVMRMLRENAALKVRPLSELVDFYREAALPNESQYPYLGLAGVESQTGELTHAAEEASGQAFAYRKGDVLYGRLRPYLNKVLFAEQDGICSTEFYVMRVKDSGVSPEYLASILRSRLIVSQTKHMMTGNTHPRIAPEEVKRLSIPVPSLETQREIAVEMTFRREKARAMRAQAEQEWREAREQFERELLGR